MNKTKKTIFWYLLLIVFSLIFILTACGSPKAPHVKKGRGGEEGAPAATGMSMPGTPAPASAPAPAPAPAPAVAAMPAAAPSAAANVAPPGTAAPDQQREEVIPTYVYRSTGLRDPFVPLLGRVEAIGTPPGEPGKAAEVNITLLVLKGYVFSQQRKHALFKSADGGTYVLDKGKLIDDRGRIVPGVAGIVKADKVVLITKKNVMKEFKLREESE